VRRLLPGFTVAVIALSTGCGGDVEFFSIPDELPHGYAAAVIRDPENGTLTAAGARKASSAPLRPEAMRISGCRGLAWLS
jgi:hypothetical protein